ncbi:MAG: hypothetical protein EZS28_028980 [Streblomastix strix]|uniref:Uncharacterized protein n=1 Tax=Streblomastix strix TaxID=222440 RepID=A0A5J4UZB2_9EUKA|nr:MAG: hypothetical protein EZS28_028980 [Streblomastix strix]
MMRKSKNEEEDDLDSIIQPRKRMRMGIDDLPFLKGWTQDAVIRENFNNITPHPTKEGIFRTRCVFYIKGPYRICVYSSCKEKGQLTSGTRSSHRYVHCCCSFEGEKCDFDKRTDHLGGTVNHSPCKGDNLKNQLIEASAQRLLSAIGVFTKIHNVETTVSSSSQMLDIIKESMKLQKAFIDEEPETLAPTLNPLKIKKVMINDAHFTCRQMLELY